LSSGLEVGRRKVVRYPEKGPKKTAQSQRL
jgi:hypothetical protein